MGESSEGPPRPSEATDESAGCTQGGMGTARLIDWLSHILVRQQPSMAQPKGTQLFPMTSGQALGGSPICSNCEALFKSPMGEAKEDSLE